ncbi:hypothetical protein AB9P05_08685 [Roseivirga sp. BDSF3-8]|uniref:hypothetical protein n=1 Tax=Roseivirga sp. BDSF3-8 TaxID=3241598 RepID=UPI003531B599
MSIERVNYLDESFCENSVIISRVQCFLYLFMLKKGHPIWMSPIIEDIKGNSQLPVPKFFFDEEMIEPFPSRKKYLIETLNKALKEMESKSIVQFFSYIKEASIDTFFEIRDDELPKQEVYHYYKDTLKKVIYQLDN